MEASLAAQELEREDHQNFNDDVENNDSDDDDQFFVDDDEFSSPSTNSDVQFNNNNPLYAYRGRINLFENADIALNQPPLPPPPLHQQHPEQNNNNNNNNNEEEEEETDFLEMDFEPENSEIENDENEMMNGHNHNLNHINGNDDNPQQHNQALENFNQLLPPQHFLQNNQNHHTAAASKLSSSDEACSSKHLNDHHNANKYTGAKPKILKQPPSEARCQKPVKQRQVTDGDQVFKITGHFSSYEDRFCDNQAGCSSSFQYKNHLNSPSTSSHSKSLHKSPHKSSCHNSHKKELLENQFLFDIEPIKPRNSATIYTNNCDEKILLDALTSLKLNPNREMIGNYFYKLRQEASELELVDYIIYRSKLNCNYLKLIELIENACTLDNDEYSFRKLEINFYPLDFFSTTPETIEVEVEEITKRWTPQTDLSPLACIKNKYFHQTNVLGKVVNIIRRLNGNHKPGTIVFNDNETIKIGQFYVSGYITITLRPSHI